MKIRFGYVAMSVLLENASPSHAVTLKTYNQLAAKDPEAARLKLRRTAAANLQNTLRLLRHNKAYGVRVFRFSSRLVPLATHPCLDGWRYVEELREPLAAIGDFVRENKIRVSFHPDHFTLLNTAREEVFFASLRDLEHHCRLLEGMGVGGEGRLVLHVGGGYRDKEKSMERFRTNWQRVPGRIQARLTLENDDKIFTAQDVYALCRALSIPMVLDLHHYTCNNAGESLAELLPLIFATWDGTGLPPKLHISSPRSATDRRSHHDFVNPADLYPFLCLARAVNRDIDIMVEAKQKDRAMLRLVKDLAACPGLEQTGDAALSFK